MSFSFQKILSRLSIRGAIKAIPGGSPDGKYEHCVPVLGHNNKIDPSMVGAATVDPGTVKAEDVGFTVPPTKDLAVTNVRDAIDNITKDTGGLALIRSKNLTDVSDADSAFNNIKQVSTAATGGLVVGGVVGLAGATETLAGTDTATDSLVSTPLAVIPSIAKSTYLSKIDTSSQTLAGALVLSGAPTVDLNAATKKYVDDSVGAQFNLPTGATIRVDQTNGNDTTGTRGTLGKPVLTLQRARDLAQVGDLILVGPGTYNANNLAVDGVSWYFQPGAKINYTGGGDSSFAIFQVSSNAVVNILGYGDFSNTHPSAASRYVLYASSGAKVVFEAMNVLSYRTAIYADLGTGYAKITVHDRLASDDGTGGGSSAAYLISGDITLTVGREIYSNGAEFQAGLRFGTVPTSLGQHLVRCPKIHGIYNAISFNGSRASHVIADQCYAIEGPAIKVSGGYRNMVTVVGNIYTMSPSYAGIVVSAGRIQLIDTTMYATNAMPAIHCTYAGSPSDNFAPYVTLNNTELWTLGYNSAAMISSPAGVFKVRVMGAVQSDCPKPTTDFIFVGGTWDYIT